jgi:hypothetical protein
MGVETHNDTSEAHAARVLGAPRRRRRWRYVPKRTDGRLRAARRAKALREHFTETLVGAGRELSVELAAAVGKAAELIALVEDMRAKALRGVEINADDLVRMQRIADASVRRLALPSGKPEPPSVDQYLNGSGST